MSKKLFIIIISLVLVFFLVSLIGYYFILKGGADETGNRTGIFRNFFPFGGSQPPTTEIPFVEEPVVEPPPITKYTQKLRKISAERVAGAGVLDTKAGTVVRHMEKATGHIFETELFSPNQTRISNTTIPVVYDALWDSTINALVARYLDDDDQTINTYGLLIKKAPTSTSTPNPAEIAEPVGSINPENIVSAIKFPANLSEISVLGSRVFSLERKIDSSVGYISDFDGSKRVQIWNSPIKELLSQYVNTRTVALTTKPHQDVEGFLFFVDTSSAQVRQILVNIYGLSTLTNDNATQILFLDQSGLPQMSIYNIANKSSVNITPITFPEKCVWSKKDRNVIYCAVPENYLERNSLTSWYLGFISTTDDIWKYDIKNNTAEMVENLYTEGGEQIDVIKPLLSENEQYLVFINKINDSLWSLDLSK